MSMLYGYLLSGIVYQANRPSDRRHHICDSSLWSQRIALTSPLISSLKLDFLAKQIQLSGRKTCKKKSTCRNFSPSKLEQLCRKVSEKSAGDLSQLNREDEISYQAEKIEGAFSLEKPTSSPCISCDLEMIAIPFFPEQT